MEIKELTKSKIKAIVDIYSQYNKKDAKIIEDVYTKFYSKPKSKRNPNIKDYVIVKDKQIIAFTGFNKEETETTDIYWMNWTSIDKDSENKKETMNLLFDFLVKELKKRRCRKLYVNTSSLEKEFIGLYKSLGFKEEARMKDYYKEGEDSIILSTHILS